MRTYTVGSWTLLVLLSSFVCVTTARMIEVEPTQEEARFWTWLQSNGADVSKLAWPALDVVTGSRGVMAKRDIHGDLEGTDVYLRIPELLMVTEYKGLNDPVFGKSLAAYKDGDKWTTEFDRIALYLIFLRNQTESFFHPYMQILPGPSTASDWTDDELKQLQDDRLANSCRRQLDDWKRKHKKLHPDYFPREVFTWDAMHWALGNVNQRAFSIRNERDEILYNAMVPGADLLNHVNIGTHYKMVGHDYVLYPVSRDVLEGEECFNGYGLVSNAHLLGHYGFALKGNAFDEVQIEFAVKRKTKQTEDEPMRITLRDQSSNEDSTLMGETIRNFPGKSLEERAANCVEICAKELKRYPTTLFDDHQELRGLKYDDTTMRQRFALHYRIGQKEILTVYEKVCTQMRKAAKASDLTVEAFDARAHDVTEEMASGWFSRYTEAEDEDQTDEDYDGEEEL